MKRTLVILLLFVPLTVQSQMMYRFTEPSDNRTTLYPSIFSLAEYNEPISKIAFTFNPLGFIQFGPFLGAEIRLKDNVALSLHTRISSLGLLSYVVRGEYLDKLTGFSVGAGPIVFLGEKMSKPYMGILLEYDRAICVYHEGNYNENTKTENNFVVFFNGGYRFRFKGGFFMGTGAFLGAVRSSWIEEHVDPQLENDEVTEVHPFGMLELTVGIEF